MKVYEFPAKIGPHGNLELPEDVARSLADEESVRVIIMVEESIEPVEDAEWSQLNASQLLTQYDDSDAIYDA